jgi:hypothetical protein
LAPPDPQQLPAPERPANPQIQRPLALLNASLLNPFNIGGMNREEMKHLAAVVAISMLLLTVIFHLVMYVIQQFE